MKLKELEKRLRSEPDNLGLRVQVAGLMREAGRSLEAVELYRSVALAYRDQGRAQQAIAVCRSILEIAPDDAACQGLLAMLQGRGTPSRPPPTLEPAPVVASAVRAATAGTAPGPSQRSPSTVTPVHITEPVHVPSMPHLRQTNQQPALPDPKPTPDPARRSSLDETPLPRAIPYHVSDPTSQPQKISARDLEEKSSAPNVTSRTGGLAEAARRISGLISAKESGPGIPAKDMDLAAELDTRQRPKIRSDELRKLAHLPPDPDETSPRVADPRIAGLIHDIETRDPALDDDLATERIDALTPPPRGSDDGFTPTPARDYTPRPGDDFYTPPPRGSDDAITPPPLLGVVPPEVIEPPRSTALPSRPPKKVSIPPAGTGKTKSVPPLGTEPPIRRAPLLSPPSARPTPQGRPLPRVPKSRDSDDELTRPRDKVLGDDSDSDSDD